MGVMGYPGRFARAARMGSTPAMSIWGVVSCVT